MHGKVGPPVVLPADDGPYLKRCLPLEKDSLDSARDTAHLYVIMVM